MKERSAVLLGIGILIIALLSIAATALGPKSDKIDVSQPDLGSDPGISPTTALGSIGTTGGPTTLGGGGPTLVTTSTTSPFQFAQPQVPVGASTTIPGPGPTFVGSPTTIAAPATTTTLSVRPALPQPIDITSVCGAATAIQSLQALFLDPVYASSPIQTQLLMQTLNADMSRWVQIAPQAIAADLIAMQGATQALLNQLQAHGWNPKDPAVYATIVAIAHSQPPFESILAQATQVQQWETSNCG